MEMAVKNICRVINAKNALPILGDVLCMVDEQQQTITMTGSDTEAWLTYRLALQGCEGGGRFCIGADLLRDALSELPEQPVTILATTESDMKFRLQHESGETILPLDNADEYPTPRHLEASRTEWTLESGMLKRVLKRSQFACANDDLRPVMNGMYFDQADRDTLNIVASNGHVLIRNAESVANEPGAFIMTKKAATLLPTLLDGDDEVTVSFDERAVEFAQGVMSFVFLMVEGKYPNYMSVIPQDAPYSLKADRQALLKAVRNEQQPTGEAGNQHWPADDALRRGLRLLDRGERPHRHRLLRRKGHDAGREGGQHHRRALAHHRADGHHPLHRPEPCRDHHPRRPALPGRGNHDAAHADAGE